MTLPPLPASPDPEAPRDPKTARIVLRLFGAISAFRGGEASGLEALDSANHLMENLADDTADNLPSKLKRPRIPPRPDRVELAVLQALADTYGSEILDNASLGNSLRVVAQHGAVALVQRVLWGESAADVRLATLLGATQAAFNQIAFAFSDDFLAQANDVLTEFRRHPPSKLDPPRGGKG